MAAQAQVAIDLIARDKASKAFKTAADSAERSGKRMGSSMGGALAGIGTKVLALGAVIGGAKVFGSLIADAEESRRVGRLTEQVIKTTGSAAKVTAGQVGALAEAISNKTGIDDEAIQSGQNLLLTFTNVRNEAGKGNDIFNRATQTITDMSAALGTDTKASAIQLGKALNDPIKGVSALSKVGVSFTEQQKEQIKTLVESGDTLGAQKIILNELGKEFGGAAEAAASPLQKLKTQLSNVGESIGTKLLPVVDGLATFVSTKLLPAVSKLGGYLTRTLGPVFSRIAEAIRIFWDAFRGRSELNEFDGKLKTLNNAGIRFAEVLRQVGEWLTTKLLPALSKVGAFLAETFAPTLRALMDYIQNRAIPAWQGLAARIKDNIAPIAKVVVVLAAVAAKILGVVLPILLKLTGFLVKTLFAAVGLAIGIIGGFARILISIGSAAKTAWDSVSRWFGKVVAFVTDLPGKISRSASGMWDGIKDAFKAAVNWIIDAWNRMEFRIPGFDPPGPGPKFGGFTLGLPDIPRLAAGGIVTKPTLALIGEAGPEEVRPLGRERGGVTVQVHVAGSVITERDLARTVRDEIAQLMRRRGASPAVLGL